MLADRPMLTAHDMSLSSESSCTPNGANANCSPAVTTSLMFIREPSWSWILDCRLWAVDCGFWTVDSEVVCWTDQDTDCGLLMFSKHPAVPHSWTSGSTFTCSWLVIHVYVFDTFFLKTEQNKRFDVLPLHITAFFPFLSFPFLHFLPSLVSFVSFPRCLTPPLSSSPVPTPPLIYKGRLNLHLESSHLPTVRLWRRDKTCVFGWRTLVSLFHLLVSSLFTHAPFLCTSNIHQKQTIQCPPHFLRTIRNQKNVTLGGGLTQQKCIWGELFVFSLGGGGARSPAAVPHSGEVLVKRFQELKVPSLGSDVEAIIEDIYTVCRWLVVVSGLASRLTNPVGSSSVVQHLLASVGHLALR